MARDRDYAGWHSELLRQSFGIEIENNRSLQYYNNKKEPPKAYAWASTCVLGFLDWAYHYWKHRESQTFVFVSMMSNDERFETFLEEAQKKKNADV